MRTQSREALLYRTDIIKVNDFLFCLWTADTGSFFSPGSSARFSMAYVSSRGAAWCHCARLTLSPVPVSSSRGLAWLAAPTAQRHSCVSTAHAHTHIEIEHTWKQSTRVRFHGAVACSVLITAVIWTQYKAKSIWRCYVNTNVFLIRERDKLVQSVIVR